MDAKPAMDPDEPHADPRRARRWVAGLVLASGVLLIVAFALPTVTFRKLGAKEEVYSILGGIRSLWDDGNFILASIVFLFSVVWPTGKLLALAALAVGRGAPAPRRSLAGWLALLGKWSMLDVFVIALFVGAIRLGLLADAASHAGIHVFALAIVISMFATLLVVRAERRDDASSGPAVEPGCEAVRGLGARVFTLLSAATLAAALSTPVLQVTKAILFRNEVALPATTLELLRGREWILGSVLAVLVIGTSGLRALLLVRVRWFGGASKRTLRATRFVDEWAMIEVFGLGMLIVYVKLDELATVKTLSGFWLVVAAALLANLDAAWFRRRLRVKD